MEGNHSGCEDNKVHKVVFQKGDAMDFFNKEMYEKGLKLQKNMMDQYMDAVENFSKFFRNDSGDSEKQEKEKCGERIRDDAGSDRSYAEERGGHDAEYVEVLRKYDADVV